MTPSGAQILLGEVAKVELSPGPSMIRDEDAQLTSHVDDQHSHPERRHALANRASEVAASLSRPRQRRQYYATIDSLLAPNGA